MTSEVKTPDLLRDTIRDGVRDASAAWWWLVALGALWIWFGMFVLSYKVGSLVAVATFVGVAFLFGGITQLVVTSRVPMMRWLSIVGGTLGVAAGIVTFVWPDITLYAVSILVAWYLIVFGTIHMVSALAGPKLSWWWTGAAARHLRAGAGGVGSPLLGALAGNAGDPGRSVGHLPRGERDLRRLHPAPGRQAGGPTGRMTTARAANSASALRDAGVFKRLTPARAGHGAKEQRREPPSRHRSARRCCGISKSAASAGRTGLPTRSRGSPAR
jgi:hypothetical protein